MKKLKLKQKADHFYFRINRKKEYLTDNEYDILADNYNQQMLGVVL